MSLAVPAPSACGSFASSPVSSAPSSLFSKESYSTAASVHDLEPLPLHHAPPPAVDPSVKAASIRLPLQLPVPPEPLEEVELSSLVVDDELEGAPVGFAVGKLRSLGPSLLNATTSTCLHIPPGPTLPPYLPCTLPPLASPAAASPVYLPSHILAIRSSDSPRTLVLPVHGLPWAAASPSLSILSSRPEKQPAHPNLPSSPRPYPSAGDADGDAYLPVVDLELPSSSAFPFLQQWVYLRSPSLLLSSLLPTPPSSPSPVVSAPASLSHLLNPSPPPTSSPTPLASLPSTPEALSQTLAAVPSLTLLNHVHRVHGLWQDAVALQISDEDLWTVMGVAWRILVAALALRERERRRRENTPPSSDEE
ncbi:hypothetical protein JCM6882_000386 [Rhodosporidiobolus microsporus]